MRKLLAVLLCLSVFLSFCGCYDSESHDAAIEEKYYDKGFSDGYDEGFNYGYTEGYEDGYRDASS